MTGFATVAPSNEQSSLVGSFVVLGGKMKKLIVVAVVLWASVALGAVSGGPGPEKSDCPVPIEEGGHYIFTIDGEEYSVHVSSCLNSPWLLISDGWETYQTTQGKVKAFKGKYVNFDKVSIIEEEK